MSSIVLPCVGLIAVLAAVGKAVQGHRRRSLTPSTLYLCGAIGSVGLSAALVAPVSLRWMSTWEPVPNLGRLVANVLAMLAAVCVQGLVAHLLHEPARARAVMRVQIPIVVLASAAMALLLLTADLPFHLAYLAGYAHHPAVAAYIVVFTLYILWSTSVFGWFLHHYIARTPRRWLRAGLRTIQAGCLASAGWAAAKITGALWVVSGRSPVAMEPVADLASACAAACVALVAAGATMPVWGPRAAVPVSWCRAVLQSRRLRPLWQRLAGELPQITLPAAMYAHADARFALYRRVVEIRDAQLVLRSYVHPEAHAWARRAAERAGLGPRRAHQVVEAACLASALDAHAAGQRHQPDPDESTAPYRGVGSDPHAEARWLIEIGRLVERSPIVADIRSRTRADVPG
ncbi:MAB_1171c family putative transporter [Saccharopolyspora sp. ID03-671]|uniref:MAB_1171c family putative transporter n=1 Tax=Saccharopolyspora sp. ID03-671 TaxID=3073066 RepID=UPI0032501EF2